MSKLQSPLPKGRGPGGTAIEIKLLTNVLAASSPSPPLEERVGERRPFTRSSLISMAVGPGGGLRLCLGVQGRKPRQLVGVLSPPAMAG